MSTINVNELLAQRAEATGVENGRVEFEYNDRKWTFRDPISLTDDEKLELEDVEGDVDVAAWYMGDGQYDEFLEAGGYSNIFLLAFQEHMRRNAEVDDEGKPRRLNRSQRRSAARKRAKQH